MVCGGAQTREQGAGEGGEVERVRAEGQHAGLGAAGALARPCCRAPTGILRRVAAGGRALQWIGMREEAGLAWFGSSTGGWLGRTQR